ncbi:aldo/keto reductase [Histomonas meleagridis]|uniref:aldo/keto reductase n=1 Tax=Histomonas meleagridis TaxID=135588 RepID=UPI00355AA2F4|nr:aldo/keto reductase [Histomonas meleagridis]KAH0801317.1 aldo/keto reductase [Histomonas meleagridis]
MEKAKLSNGVEIPLEGFGVFQIPDLDQCKQAVLDAINAGYRLIDTATYYHNEEAVGAAIKECGIPRDQLFIVSKVWPQDAGYENTKIAFETSLNKLGLDYLDLYLVHQPFGDYYGSWRALQELYEAKKVRAIGVSNFYPDRLLDLCLNVKIIPHVNQVECNPFFQRVKEIEIMKEYNILMEAWAPLAEARFGIFENETLKKIAANHNKTVAQIILRWNTQRGIVVLPKSVHKERIEENFNIWDFKLTDEEMGEIAKLDKGHSQICNHYDPAYVKKLNNAKVH